MKQAVPHKLASIQKPKRLRNFFFSIKYIKNMFYIKTSSNIKYKKTQEITKFRVTIPVRVALKARSQASLSDLLQFWSQTPSSRLFCEILTLRSNRTLGVTVQTPSFLLPPAWPYTDILEVFPNFDFSILGTSVLLK